MKNSAVFISLFLLFILIATGSVYAVAVPSSPASAPVSAAHVFSSGGIFGGRIIDTKATEIRALESAGYNCFTLGSSISIMLIGSPAGTPTSYFIPYYVIPKTRTQPASGRLILGKYGGTATINCTLASDPPQTTTVALSTITLFATSGGGRAGAAR